MKGEGEDWEDCHELVRLNFFLMLCVWKQSTEDLTTDLERERDLLLNLTDLLLKILRESWVVK